ncbi:MAG: AAA family ATPase [Clostridiales bacterium]|nr:AAA family ATPase [Clostridiales bacterium]
MLFFKIEGKITNMTKKQNKEHCQNYDYANLMRMQLNLMNAEDFGVPKCAIFLCSIRNNELVAGAVADCIASLEEKMSAFGAATALECRDIRIEEIRCSALRALAELGSNNNFLRSASDIFDSFDLEGSLFRGHSDLKYKDYLLPPLEEISKGELTKRATRLLFQSILPEIERIYQPPKHQADGHPVHYFLQTDDDGVAVDIAEILMSALLANGRLKSRRFSVVDTKKKWSRYDGYDEFEELYMMSAGGAVVVDLSASISKEDDEYLSNENEKVAKICQISCEHRNSALTVFRLPRAADRLKKVMREHLGTMTVIDLTEDIVSAETAKAYLQGSARVHDVKGDKALYKCVGDPIKTYSVSDLNKEFRQWYDNQLKTRCYTQYACFDSSLGISAKESKPKGAAYVELEKMIGLSEAKSVINQAVDFYKAQKLFKDRGMAADRPAMHMVFTGSPGTAKTSVARLFAQIMRDNQVLSVGNLVECGRADLVSRYLGGTAPDVRRKFKEAMGSVLFIDEAYSLAEERSGLYGDEAINAIVQEMENRREDLVVIFAGYTDKMEGFLQKNPGLRSRIAFHVPFADYDTDELLAIMELMAKKQSMTLGKDVDRKVRGILGRAIRHPDFGNGRYVRNMLENARMKQASRLLRMDAGKITDEKLKLLVADDFEELQAKKREVERIGFAG